MILIDITFFITLALKKCLSHSNYTLSGHSLRKTDGSCFYMLLDSRKEEIKSFQELYPSIKCCDKKKVLMSLKSIITAKISYKFKHYYI